MNQSHYLTEKRLAKEWGVSYKTLQQWRWQNIGPDYLKLGGMIRYTPQAIRAFEASKHFAACMARVKKRKQGVRS